jgi:hypothetical protein
MRSHSIVEVIDSIEEKIHSIEELINDYEEKSQFVATMTRSIELSVK